MKKNTSFYIKGWYGIVLLIYSLSTGLYAQQDTICNPFGDAPYLNKGTMVYGAAAGMSSFGYQSDILVGQPYVACTFPTSNSQEMITGALSSFFTPAEPPLFLASQGDYPDFVELEWVLNSFSPNPSEFRIFRDGIFLAKVEEGTLNYIDFNVQAGNIYEYSIIAYTEEGVASLPAQRIGFVNPNGVISGQVLTTNGNPVPNATVVCEPSFGQSLAFDGVDDNLCVSYNEQLSDTEWTFSTWVKMGNHDGEAIIDLGRHLNSNWWMRTTPSNAGKGIVAGIGDGNNQIEHTVAFTDTPDDWHHVAAVYNGAALTVYLDGTYSGSINGVMDTIKTRFRIGKNLDDSGYFEGLLDDVRIYDRALSQTEILMKKDISESSRTEGLIAYWKFDEGIGETAFDISGNEMDAQIYNGATFSSDAPEILNASITDVDGNYLIEGINYSQANQLTVTPRKSFFDNYALEFNAANTACATLPDFDIPDTNTVEVVFMPFDTESMQSILSKQSNGTDVFNLYLDQNQYYLTINGQTQQVGTPSGQYEHLSITMDASTDDVEVYQNGNLLGTFSYGNVGGDWSGDSWVLGAVDAANPTNFFTGLIDEVVIYDIALTQAEIQLNASLAPSGGTNGGSANLVAYYNLNESEGTELFDFGPNMLADGAAHQTSYSIVTRRQKETPHVFRPNSRNVNLNYSNTSVGNVNFTDESTVAVSGVVRFQNTTCYQDSVEILVNGSSYFPPIFTNSDGEFIADFEPGANVVLSPSYGQDSTAHNFLPAFYEVRRLNVPVANVLFQNTTKREIEGQIYGGLCRKSVIPVDANGDPTAIVKVKLSALNGCYEEEKQLLNPNGKFTFSSIPPIPVAVSVIEHSNNIIYNYFQVQGGQEFDMREIKKDTVDFMYVSAPNVEIGEISDIYAFDCSGLNPLNTPIVRETYLMPRTTLTDGSTEKHKYSNEIKVYEQYIGADDGICYLDSFNLVIDNGLQESPQQTVVSDTSIYNYEYHINNPNLLSPYTKNLNITAEVNGAQATATYTAVVLGQRQQENTIATRSPSRVHAILHDPPGDASSATWSEGTGSCESWESAEINSESLDVSVEMEFGKKLTTFVGLGGGTINEIEFTNKSTIAGSFNVSETVGSTGEYCWETLTEISTSDGDDIWGDYADVYFGAALNFEIGARDVLEYDPEMCAFSDTIILSINPADTFSTEFVYTEWQILTDVIPQLELAYAQTGNPLDSIDAKRWQEVVDENRNRTFSTDPEHEQTNITFDAGATYTQSRTTSRETSYTYEYNISAGGELSTEFGFDIFGQGSTQNISIGYSHDWSEISTTNYSSEVTTEFTLADDDLNDFYSVDVGVDPKYGTPMFELKGGESMCPWIPGTRNREEVSIQVENPIAINVPANTPAVFRVTLGNIGPNGVDGLVYELGVDEGGNPDGAIIKVDGSPLINPIEFQFIGTSSVQKTVTVEYPNTGQFDFEDLGLYFATVCQIEHSESVGYDAGDGGFLIYDDFSAENGGENYYNRFYQSLELDVYFIEPCSPIDIGFPLQNHVMTPADAAPNGDLLLNVTLNEYVNTDPDLELVRVQYRPIPGDGSWINITELPAADFANDPVFKIVQWDMTDLKDGDYEIRAITQCFDVSLAPGISEVILVTKETDAPQLFGTPQPADGILTVGDEISIQFNEFINCNTIDKLNNLSLVDGDSGRDITFNYQCVDDKIVFTIEEQAKFVDGLTLVAKVIDIEDLAGNVMAEPIGGPGSPTQNFKEWEFLVDLNPLRWEEGSNITEVKQEGDLLAITRNLLNNSGSSMNYRITGPAIPSVSDSTIYETIPSWMLVNPKVGTLDPGEVQPITFVFPQDLLVDDYLSEINVVGSQGDNDITVDLKVRCEGPDWDFDRINDFENTMTFTVQVDVFGEITVDNSDRVAAFINGELRGLAYIEKVEAFDGIDNNNDGLVNDDDIEGQYMAFLTVYGDETDNPIVDFNFFDGSECIVYSEVIEQIPYEPTAQEGTPTNPTVLHLINVVDRKIPLAQGWTWISVNLDLTDNSTDNVLTLLDNKDGDLIKDDNTFAQYLSGTWVGSMTDIGFEKRYMYYTPQEDTLCLTGMPYDPTTSTIPITTGWNWIGFVPQQGMSVDNALASLNPLNGDLVKSQIAFAQYIAGFGWIGNLNVMQAPNGYLLNISNAGTLEYDPTLQARDVNLLEKREPTVPYWDINSNLYQHNMNITAIINPEDYQLEENDQIGVFANGELRGYGEAIYVEPLKEHYLFITAYGDEQSEDLDFVLFSQRDSSLTNLNESITFAPDRIVGTALEPFVFNIGGATSTTNLDTDLDVSIYPNPSRYEFNIEFNSDKTQQVFIQLLNAQGQVIETLDVDVPIGQHTLQYNARTLPSGVYNMNISGKDLQVQKKLIKIN